MERKERFARTILNGFESYFAEFQNITLAAKSWFENADWHGIQRASGQRIDMYKTHVGRVIEYVELIADGHHSAVDALALVMKLKPADRIILVSDANTLMGANVGQSTQFGGQRITLTADGSINEEGKLAGATCLLDGAIRNLVKWHLASFPQAVQMATANPARYLGENTHFGELKPDALADIALWDRQSLTIKQTLLQGRVVYEANQAEAAQKAS